METTLDKALTTEDIRALRGADSISFHARWLDGEVSESLIRGRKRDAENSDYVSALVHVGSTFSYGGAIVRDNPDVRAYESCLSAKFHEHWTTVVSLLRTGDVLTLVWSANGHRNGIAKEHGLAVDSLDIRIDRKRRRMTFGIEQRVSEYNSARMFAIGDSFNPVTSDRNTDLTS